MDFHKCSELKRHFLYPGLKIQIYHTFTIYKKETRNLSKPFWL